MSLELLGRLQKEFAITGYAVHETVLAIAERVNRKVQTLRLHWQAAHLLTRIEQQQIALGRMVCAGLVSRTTPGTPEPSQLDGFVIQAVDRIHRLKQTSIQLDARIRKLNLEAIPEELVRLQQELWARGAAIERVSLTAGMQAIGRTVGELALSPSVRVVSIIRGPFFILPGDEVVLREDDVVILIGSTAQLGKASTRIAGSSPTESLHRIQTSAVVE